MKDGWIDAYGDSMVQLKYRTDCTPSFILSVISGQNIYILLKDSLNLGDSGCRSKANQRMSRYYNDASGPKAGERVAVVNPAIAPAALQ